MRARSLTAHIHGSVDNFFYRNPESDEVQAMELWLGSIGPLRVRVAEPSSSSVLLDTVCRRDRAGALPKADMRSARMRPSPKVWPVQKARPNSPSNCRRTTSSQRLPQSTDKATRCRWRARGQPRQGRSRRRWTSNWPRLPAEPNWRRANSLNRRLMIPSAPLLRLSRRLRATDSRCKRFSLIRGLRTDRSWMLSWARPCSLQSVYPLEIIVSTARLLPCPCRLHSRSVLRRHHRRWPLCRARPQGPPRCRWC